MYEPHHRSSNRHQTDSSHEARTPPRATSARELVVGTAMALVAVALVAAPLVSASFLTIVPLIVALVAGPAVLAGVLVRLWALGTALLRSAPADRVRSVAGHLRAVRADDAS